MPIAKSQSRQPALRLLATALVAATLAAAPEAAGAANWVYWGPGVGPMLRHPPISRKHGKAQKPAAELRAEKTKPEGPLIITISVQHQRLRVYDSNGLFAEAPVSTGMAGHSTPMGVFSVIEKQRWHRSNIYSGAPMPYMQRITWSGIALHEGVLPGYPASHGCIRMPQAFAIKLWAWTKRGARVIIVPGEISPQEFAHPKLIARMLEEQKPSASLAPAGATTLAATVGKSIEDKPELKLATLADAGGNSVQIAKSTGNSATDDAKPESTAGAANEAAADARPTEASDGVKDAQPAQASDPAAAPAAARPIDRATDDVTEQAVERAIDQAAAMVEAAPVKLDSPSPATGIARASDTAVATSSAPVQAVAPKPVATTKVEATAPALPNQAASDAPASDPNDAPTVIAPKRTGHIAVFISRKDSRLYVRQNFSPLFDVPVTITDADKPFGTFVFTALGDKSDAAALHWSLVTMPFATRKTVAIAGTRSSKKGKPVVQTSLTAPPASAADVLDRITVPAWAVQRVAEAIKPGGSLIISDHGLGDETGEGTDFIVPLR